MGQKNVTDVFLSPLIMVYIIDYFKFLWIQKSRQGDYQFTLPGLIIINSIDLLLLVHQIIKTVLMNMNQLFSSE